MTIKQKQRIAIVQMLICSALWSIAGIFIKLIDWNPFAIAGARSLLAAVTVLVYMGFSKQKIVLSRNVLLSMAFLAGTFLCFVAANKLTTAANAIVLQYTAPIFILVFSALFLGQRFRSSEVITVAAALVGISIFFLESLNSGGMLGNLVGVCAGVFMACMFLTVGKTQEGEKMSGILFGHLLTALIGLPFLLFTPHTFSVGSVGSIFILGIVQLGIPYILFGLASANCPPLPCSLIAAVEPLLNPAWVFFFDGERPGLLALVGGVIVIGAVTAQCILQDKHAAQEAQLSSSQPQEKASAHS